MKLILKDGHMYRTEPNMVPVRKTKHGPLEMEQQGFKPVGIPCCKIIMGDRENNPMMEILKPYLIEEGKS